MTVFDYMSLQAQSNIVPKEIHSIDVNPTCPYQLAFHLDDGWYICKQVDASFIICIYIVFPVFHASYTWLKKQYAVIKQYIEHWRKTRFTVCSFQLFKNSKIILYFFLFMLFISNSDTSFDSSSFPPLWESFIRFWILTPSYIYLCQWYS